MDCAKTGGGPHLAHGPQLSYRLVLVHPVLPNSEMAEHPTWRDKGPVQSPRKSLGGQSLFYLKWGKKGYFIEKQKLTLTRARQTSTWGNTFELLLKPICLLSWK